MPITFATFLIATLAIAGVPPSRRLLQQGRDPLAARSPAGTHAAAGVIGVVTARADRVLHVPPALPDLLRRAAAPTTTSQHHVHESPPVDDGAAGRCWRCCRSSAAGSGCRTHWLWGNRLRRVPRAGHPATPHVEHGGVLGEGALMAIATALRRRRRRRSPTSSTSACPDLPMVAELAPARRSTRCCSTSTGSTSSTTRIVVRPYVRARRRSSGSVVDAALIDGVVNGVGARRRRRRAASGAALQTGNVQHYALSFLGRRDRRDARLLRAALTVAMPIRSSPLIVFTPLVGALLLGCCCRASSATALRRAALVVLAGAVRCCRSLLLAALRSRATAASSSSSRHAWIPSFGIHYQLGVDGISLFLVLLTTLPHAARRARLAAATSTSA